MRTDVQIAALLMSVALASCATAPRVACPPASAGPNQAVMLRTDPPGATCTVMRAGVVVASVEFTPDYAIVPRRNEPVEIVCRKGDLEHRMVIDAVRASEVKEEAATGRACSQSETAAIERSASRLAEGLLAGLAGAFPPVAIGVLVVGAVGATVAATAEPRYAIRPPPELFLARAAFASISACDEYFAALKARLEAEADAQRARIGASCHPWPCTAADTNCPNPLCQGQRARVDAELERRLQQLPDLRVRARIAPP